MLELNYVQYDLEDTMVDGRWYASKMFNRNADASVGFKWTERLKSGQQVRVTEAFSIDENLKSLGYSLALVDC